MKGFIADIEELASSSPALTMSSQCFSRCAAIAGNMLPFIPCGEEREI